jgi:8-oxo-dGTP diphosphatase
VLAIDQANGDVAAMVQPFTETPNAASVALLRQQQVLLIQRAFAPWQGAWSLPGGRLEPGESAEQCAIRELHEELGLTVSELRPIAQLQLGEGRPFRLQVYATGVFSGTIAHNAEISAWRWISPGDEQALKTTPHLSEVLARAYRLIERS